MKKARHRDEVEMVLQVNGKARGRIMMAATADQHAVEEAARDNPQVSRLRCCKGA